MLNAVKHLLRLVCSFALYAEEDSSLLLRMTKSNSRLMTND